MCTPAVRALKQRFPGSYMAFLVERGPSDVLKLNPHINELMILEKERYKNPLYGLEIIRKVRKKGFDLVIDYLGNPRTAYISLLSGARQKVGYHTPRRRWFYNLLVKDDATGKYSAAHKLQILRCLGIESQDVHLDFFLSDEARFFSQRFFEENRIGRDNLVVSISPTSRRHFRRWPAERYARLADWLISELRAAVILLWGPGEKETVEEVKRLMSRTPLICRETRDLLQLGGILGRCDLHIGNDNGTKHIAVALGKPTLTIFGPEDPKSWTYPDPTRHRFVKAQVNGPDSMIAQQHSAPDSIDRIVVEEVQKVLLGLLRDLRKTEKEGFVRKIEHPAIN